MKHARTYVRTVLALLTMLVIVMAVAVWAVDPFWVWHKEPSWVVAQEGRNLNLDRRMRLAKTLQIFSRDTKFVVIGSSKVTRGFDLADGGYNMGIASLRVRELEGMVAHLLHWKKVDTLVIGLDYTMFDAHTPFEEGYAPEMARPGYAFEALLSSMFSRDALDAIRLLRQGEGNRWHWNGYQESALIDAEENRRLAKNLAMDAATIRQPDAATYAALDRTLALSAARGVNTIIYLSPAHISVRHYLKAAGAQPLFGAWRDRVKAIAAKHHIAVHDLTEAPLTNDAGILLRGSTALWSDPSHFTPLLGAWILRTVGVE